MATTPNWRNQGIGTRMILYLLEDLKESDQEIAENATRKPI
ncbi:hypothetical protein ACSYAD_28955 [Acaryochloris marina NIES-2412]